MYIRSILQNVMGLYQASNIVHIIWIYLYSQMAYLAHFAAGIVLHL